MNSRTILILIIILIILQVEVVKYQAFNNTNKFIFTNGKQVLLMECRPLTSTWLYIPEPNAEPDYDTLSD